MPPPNKVILILVSIYGTYVERLSWDSFTFQITTYLYKIQLKRYKKVSSVVVITPYFHSNERDRVRATQCGHPFTESKFWDNLSKFRRIFT